MFDITRAGNVATLDGIVSAARDCGYAVTLVEFDEEGRCAFATSRAAWRSFPLTA